MNGPGYWADLFPFGVEEAKGSGESLFPHPPIAIDCQTQTSAPNHLQPMALLNQEFLEGGKRHLKKFFFKF